MTDTSHTQTKDESLTTAALAGAGSGDPASIAPNIH